MTQGQDTRGTVSLAGCERTVRRGRLQSDYNWGEREEEDFGLENCAFALGSIRSATYCITRRHGTICRRGREADARDKRERENRYDERGRELNGLIEEKIRNCPCK